MKHTHIPRTVRDEIRASLAECERILTRQYRTQTRRRIFIAGPTGALMEILIASAKENEA